MLVTGKPRSSSSVIRTGRGRTGINRFHLSNTAISISRTPLHLRLEKTTILLVAQLCSRVILLAAESL